MANVNNPNGFRAVKSLSGSYLPTFSYMTKTNVAIKAGDAVIMLSNGTIDIALAASATIFGVSQSTLTAESGVSKKILVVPASKDIVFSGQCSGTYTPVNAGESVDIEGATGVMQVNEDAQSTNVLRIVGLEGGLNNAVGANARVLFTWCKSQWAGD